MEETTDGRYIHDPRVFMTLALLAVLYCPCKPALMPKGKHLDVPLPPQWCSFGRYGRAARRDDAQWRARLIADALTHSVAACDGRAGQRLVRCVQHSTVPTLRSHFHHGAVHRRTAGYLASARLLWTTRYHTEAHDADHVGRNISRPDRSSRYCAGAKPAGRQLLSQKSGSTQYCLVSRPALSC